MRNVFGKAYAVLASTGLAVVVLLLLLLLTLLGTLEQANTGLFEVQKKYFESIFLVEWLFGAVPVPLPGVYLLLVLLAVNLILGAILKVRFAPAKIGIFIAHVGVVGLLVGGFLTYRLADRGTMLLHEKPTAKDNASSEYMSDYDWEVAIRPEAPAGATSGAAVKEMTIPEARFQRASPEAPVVFRSEALPFDVSVVAWLKNAAARPAERARRAATAAVDGFVLERLTEEKEAEVNRRGVHVQLSDKSGGGRTEVLLCGDAGREGRPFFFFPSGGRRWIVDLRKARHDLPFTVRLEKFIAEFHPRTRMPKSFRSDVTKIDRGVEQRVRISMNEPLRQAGFTLYQHQYGASDSEGPYSVLAVVRNPADDLPLWATLTITAGLLIQFVRRIVRYIRAESGRKA